MWGRPDPREEAAAREAPGLAREVGGKIGDGFEGVIGGCERGGWAGVAECDDAHAGVSGGVDPGRGVLDGEAFGGRNAECGGGVKVAVGEGFGAFDVVGGCDGAEVVVHADRLEHGDDDGGTRAGADGEGDARGGERDGFGRAGLHGVSALGDAFGHEGTFAGEEFVGEVIGEGGVVPAGDGDEGAFVASTDDAVDELLMGEGPVVGGDGFADGPLMEGLGIDEDAVEVEDDGSHGVDGTSNQ